MPRSDEHDDALYESAQPTEAEMEAMWAAHLAEQLTTDDELEDLEQAAFEQWCEEWRGLTLPQKRAMMGGEFGGDGPDD